jgi:hypothetical protein
VTDVCIYDILPGTLYLASRAIKNIGLDMLLVILMVKAIPGEALKFPGG